MHVLLDSCQTGLQHQSGSFSVAELVFPVFRFVGQIVHAIGFCKIVDIRTAIPMSLEKKFGVSRVNSLDKPRCHGYSQSRVALRVK